MGVRTGHRRGDRVKPSPWQVDPARVDPAWRWAWVGMRGAWAFWEKADVFEALSGLRGEVTGNWIIDGAQGGLGLDLPNDADIVDHGLPDYSIIAGTQIPADVDGHE